MGDTADSAAREMWAPDDGADRPGWILSRLVETSYFQGDRLVGQFRWDDRGLFNGPTAIGDYDRVEQRRLWYKSPPRVKMSLRDWLEASKWSDDPERDEEQIAAIDRAIELLAALAPDQLDS